MNRGAGHRDIFDHAGNARHFLDLLGQSQQMFNVEVHAYCLMTNHYHLLVRSVDGQLSDFMHRIASIYARSLNSERHSDGPLFRDRFHSLLCRNTTHVDNAWRYIHRNPLHLAPLDVWQWSSYRCYMGRAPRPPWLTTSVWLDWHGSRTALRRFVEGDADHDDAVPADRWRWAIETATAEYGRTSTEPLTQGMLRTVTIATAARCGDPVAVELLTPLAFAHDGARDRAVRRAVERVATSPKLEAIIRRAASLAGSHVVP